MHRNLWVLNLGEWMAWIAELQSRKTLVTWRTEQQKPQVSVNRSAKVLRLKEKTSIHGYSLGRDWLNSSLAEEQRDIIVGPKLNASQDWVQVKLHNKGQHPPVNIQEGSSWTWGISSSPGRWHSTETGCPGGSVRLYPQGFTRPGWIKLQVTWSIDGDSPAWSKRLD